MSDDEAPEVGNAEVVELPAPTSALARELLGADGWDRLFRERLANVDEQLEQIDEAILSGEVRHLIRQAAAAWALWLELDDQLDGLGLTVAFGGGVEYPAGECEAVAVVEIDGIKLGTLAVKRDP